MVLNFDAKDNDNINERILFSFFKMGYVSRKYTFFPKVFYSLYAFIEIIFIIFFLSVNQCDILNTDIKNYGSYFSNTYNKNLLYYKNFDNQMSYIINFLNFFSRMDLWHYILGLSFILLIFLVKLWELIYFSRSGIPVIKVSFSIKIFFYICGIIDLALRTYADILILSFCILVFSCTSGTNSFLNLTCWKDTHLILLIIVSFFLFMLFCNLIFQIMFYDVTNLLDEENMGLCDNLRSEFIHFTAKIILVVLNIIIVRDNQETFKVWIYFTFTFLILFLKYQNMVKFHNFYNNIILFKHSSLFIYSGFMIPYAHLQMDITLRLFIFIILISFLGGFLIQYALQKYKVSSLYARVSFIQIYIYLTLNRKKILKNIIM